MRIVQKLKELGTHEGAVPYVFGSMAQINLLLDKLNRQREYPVFVQVQPVEGTLYLGEGTYNAGVIADEPHVMVGYGDRIRLDYDAEKVEDMVSHLKGLCVGLLADIMRSGLFSPIEDVTYSVMFDKMDANIVLVLMDFRLRDAEGDCIDAL